MATPTATGTVDFDAKAGKPVQTWYQVYGDLKSGVTPVVALHGGPGSTHHYILPLIDLATLHAIPVVFYDQVGNGSSTHLPEKSGDAAGFWTEQLFLDELDNLIRHLGIQDDYALLGQSWGGMLAARHASKQPKGLKRLVISESPASIALFEKAAKEELIAGLPADVAVCVHSLSYCRLSCSIYTRPGCSHQAHGGRHDRLDGVQDRIRSLLQKARVPAGNLARRTHGKLRMDAEGPYGLPFLVSVPRQSFPKSC